MADSPEQKSPRKSVITKTITRKFNTAKYETLDLSVQQTHEIEWTSIDMLRAKSNSITTLLTEDFNQTVQKVFTDLHLDEYLAFINSKGPSDSSSSGEKNKNNLSEKDKKEFDKLS